MRVLVLNPGSSTLKAGLVRSGTADAPGALVEWAPEDDASTATTVVRSALDRLPSEIDAVGYRVVHGGRAYRSASSVDAELLATVERLDALAPLHNRRAAAVMRAGMELLADVPHVACFDTAVHADLPEEGWRYALPREWVERWEIRRFGFHGLSVAWAIRRAAELLDRPASELRLVVAHLGSGCSVTAVDGGRSVATSMGFTPLEGPMMGTRSGSVDPGILLHLLEEGLSTEALADGLAHRSGLLAIAGTADVREVEKRAADGDPAARLGLTMFAAQAAAAIGAAATALPAVDALAFTGGIGEHSRTMRAAIVRRLAGLSVPPQITDVEADGIAAHGPPAILVIESREDLVIADQVVTLVRRQAET